MRLPLIDYRIGGNPRFRYCEEAELMRVPDELRECVCFIRAQWPSGTSSLGTAFFVGVPLGVEGRWFHYAVTARHCIVDLKAAEAAVLEINQRCGARVAVSTRVSDWLLHETADVAVLPLGEIDPAFEVTAWDADKSVANDDIVREKNIGAGDDVFITGLLVYHPGVTRNLPIVRLGSIAAMPEDPVELTTGTDIVHVGGGPLYRRAQRVSGFRSSINLAGH